MCGTPPRSAPTSQLLSPLLHALHLDDEFLAFLLRLAVGGGPARDEIALPVAGEPQRHRELLAVGVLHLEGEPPPVEARLQHLDLVLAANASPLEIHLVESYAAREAALRSDDGEIHRGRGIAIVEPSRPTKILGGHRETTQPLRTVRDAIEMEEQQ